MPRGGARHDTRGVCGTRDQNLFMRILHVVPSIHASTGGPAVSVTRLASEQARLGHKATIACLEYPRLGPQVEAPSVQVVAVPGNVLAVRGRGWSREFRRIVREEAMKADIVHNHGLWMWPNVYAREAAVAEGKPLVISPRGMLEAWSLKRSRIRKMAAWRLFEKKNMQSATLFHATADSEAGSIRRMLDELGEERPIVVAPNGVDLPDSHHKPERRALEVRFPQLRNRRWMVFMSRLHPKKGIDILLQAWRDGGYFDRCDFDILKEKGEDRCPILIIAGADLTGHGKGIERMIRELNLQDSVVLTGEVQGGMKDCLLENAEVFVLPSYSENFGIAIAEALAWGCPVITTTGTPWKEIADFGAGWWIEPKVAALRTALDEAMGKSAEELAKMGGRGRRLVEERYGWEAAAARLVRAYEEVL